MKKFYFFTVLFTLFIFTSSRAQTPQWYLLPDSPSQGRYDDLYFINAFTGWAVGEGSVSRIIKTTNGGINWQLLASLNNSYSRAICFLDSVNGFIGTLNGSQHLYKTTDGGHNWAYVDLKDDSILGICGLNSFGNTIIGSGMYSGYPRVVISTDRGSTWRVKNLIAYANVLVDCYLVNETEAFVTGGTGTTYTNRRSVILYTSNAGETWVSRFISTRTGNWGWKISFPSQTTGYISLENNNLSDSSYFAKTTDGGLTWSEKLYGAGLNFREQGIGFVNETTGWMGGYTKFYATTNGGNDWKQLNVNPEFTSINRIRFYGDTLGYAGGRRIYKYTIDNTIGVSGSQSVLPVELALHQNFPNPFNPVTTIKYEIFETSMSKITIYNVSGEEIFSYSNGFRAPGIFEFTWFGTDYSGRQVPSGVYFYTLETEKNIVTKKMILIK